MPEYTIRGIRINFPYKAYPNQLVYMEKVIACLQDGENALLESPTGTGKTLCLLCAVLAYTNSKLPQRLKYIYELDPLNILNETIEHKTSKIIYASRTHSQLSQVISELRKTHYRPKTCILGSRDQLCRHSDVVNLKGNTAKTALCHLKVIKKNCQFHLKVPEAKKSPMIIDSAILDIEDLSKLADSYGACPYYLTREQLEEADIIFIPYNYLIDPQTRANLGLDITNAILILDEAHNLEGYCSEAYSFDISSTDFENAIQSIQKSISLPSSLEQFPGLNNINIELAKTFVTQVYSGIINLVNQEKSNKCIRNGSFLYELFRKFNLNENNYTILVDSIDECIKRLYNIRSAQISETHIHGLASLLNIVKILFSYDNKDTKSFSVSGLSSLAFKTIIEKTVYTHPNYPKWILSYWCFNPGLAINSLKVLGASSIIMTSGTLAPLDSLSKEFYIPFKYQLENTHVIESDQVLLGIISKGPSGKHLDSSYKNRNSIEYLNEVGSTIENISRIIPDGILVFFPSYALMDSCLENWKKSIGDLSIWDAISKNKDIFVESKDKFNFNAVLDSYRNASSRKGAIFFAIARGKVSEGIDFSDSKARGVIMIGVPYPSLKDPKIELKKDYLDDRPKTEISLSWNEWYTHQALRAVNQAIGRAIRHKNDFGVIVLCDKKFGQNEIIKYLPSWMKKSLKNCSHFKELQPKLIDFFKNIKPLDNSFCSSLSSNPISSYTFDQSPKLEIRNASITKSAPALYFEKIKRELSMDKFKEFQSTLLSFKEDKIDAIELIMQMRNILKDNDPILFRNFNLFIPKNFHTLHEQLCKGK